MDLIKERPLSLKRKGWRKKGLLRVKVLQSRSPKKNSRLKKKGWGKTKIYKIQALSFR